MRLLLIGGGVGNEPVDAVEGARVVVLHVVDELLASLVVLGKD